MQLKTKTLMLQPHQIELKPDFNRRFDYGDMKGLTASVLEYGVITPVHVVKTKRKTEDSLVIYELIDGHRRFRAVNTILPKVEVGTLIVPAIEMEAGEELAYLAHQFVTGANQQPLNLLEKAMIVDAFLKAEYTKKQIVETLGITMTTVNDLHTLITKSTPKLRKQVEQGKLSATALLEMLKNGEVNAEEVEEAVADAIATTGKAKVTKKDITKAAGKDLTKRVTKEDLEDVFDNEAEDFDEDLPVDKVKDKRKGAKQANEGLTALDRLNNLRSAVLQAAPEDSLPVKVAFSVLDGIIALLEDGNVVSPVDLLPLFYEETLAGKAAKEKKPATKKVPAKKAAPVVEDDLDELDEVAPPVKKAPAKKGKTGPPKDLFEAEPDEDLDLDEDLDNDPLDPQAMADADEDQDLLDDLDDLDF